uniref:SWDC1503 n=1 Tax=Arundo donax TaxID=35708 RepID=A0A0A9EJE3_ARUDO
MARVQRPLLTSQMRTVQSNPPEATCELVCGLKLALKTKLVCPLSTRTQRSAPGSAAAGWPPGLEPASTGRMSQMRRVRSSEAEQR